MPSPPSLASHLLAYRQATESIPIITLSPLPPSGASHHHLQPQSLPVVCPQISLSDFSRIYETLNLYKGFLLNSRYSTQPFRHLQGVQEADLRLLRASLPPPSPLLMTCEPDQSWSALGTFQLNLVRACEHIPPATQPAGPGPNVSAVLITLVKAVPPSIPSSFITLWDEGKFIVLTAL